MLSIVIVNYKSSKDIDICLQSIIKNDPHWKEFEIIVVDNNSGDRELADLLKKHPFVLIIYAERNGGFSYGNNIGIKKSHHDVIFLLNPDTWVNDDSISRLYSRLINDEHIDLAGPVLLFPDGKNQTYFLPKSHLTLWRLFCEQFYLHRIFKHIPLFNSYFRTYMDYGQECNVEQISGAAFMFKKNILDKIGFLDETFFMYFEESDYCLNAVRHGMNLLYYPESKIFHSGGLTNESNSPVLTKYYIDSFKYYFIKNFGKTREHIAFIIFIAGSLLRLIGLRLIGSGKYRYYKNVLANIFS